jgi:hypothetical protein
MKKLALLLKGPKLNKSASPRYLVLFSDQKLMLARALRVPYDQNYGLKKKYWRAFR